MRCHTCGDETSPSDNECQNCHTPHGQPALAPGVPTYPVRGIGLAASIAVGATALLYLVVALFPLVGAVLAGRARESQDPDVLLGAVLIEVVLSLPFLLAYLTAAVLVIIWTWRARKNLDAFPGALPHLGAGWAIAGWLVPFANFVVPARVVANLARDSLWKRFTPDLVFVWWVAWLAFSLGERFVSRRDDQAYARLPEQPRSDTEFRWYADYYREALGWHLIPLVACLVAAGSLIVLIRRISTAQEQRIALGRPAWPAHPGWPAPGAPPGYAYPAQPVTGSSPQVVTDPTVASPQVPPGAGGTIGA
ncbi:protein of unknown function (DUF4328) [Micromonospora viridifaciens]|uniref:DUF4328 domain-containing protein n=1 Tax=Micromonospora viridifaciens TaxID=1881 RepID=A0A1C4ZTS3_MICVI|nr:DUF4328 domain-containing protein [Micromonospora viridifaciens]SCF36191.1 protein of unknown function (DUF4328) [Micromonospora viridifaciens]